MTQTIFKYELPRSQRFTLDLPKFGDILHIGVIYNIAYMWVLVDPDVICERRSFTWIETGETIDLKKYEAFDKDEYRGTVILDSGNYVIHLFEVT